VKFTLKDYQDEAVRDVLAHVRKARKRWHEEGEKHAFSLTAPTGAGKTVMAAAVFEALFHSDDSYEFDADPGAVVIWFSDDPSLNEQTRARLMECSDRLRHTDLIVVENSFNRDRFEPGKIYFLNTQKLGKNSLLVRGFDGEPDAGLFPESRPDMRSHTIWDTIRNTIEDPSLTLYLVLDEAHRGMGNPGVAAQNERTTLVRRLINGDKGVPSLPVVLGISATVDRFNKAMEAAQGRTRLPDVKVDASRVQESGLLKDTIALDIPDEAGKFDSVLMRRATDKLRESTEEWASYVAEQGGGEVVVPLMVLQVPNTPNHNEIGSALDTIFQQWPELPEQSVAHVLGEHSTQRFGSHSVPYIPPERVQDETWVRVLIAKDAISTGWDCPRAEVMMSFRPAQDQTHITQLLGRMVRTPLARRIPGNARLNSVACLLPFFDKGKAEKVAEALNKGDGEGPPLGRVLINPKVMNQNPLASSLVWDKFTSLPSQTRPQRGAKPPIRLTALAQELADDKLLQDAGAQAHAAMHELLDAFLAANGKEFAERREKIMTVEGRTVIADRVKSEVRSILFQTEADDAVINDAYRRAARLLSPDIARTYTEAIAKRKDDADSDFESALIEAREEVAALGAMGNLEAHFYAEADTLANAWLAQYRDRIKQLPDDRQEAYRQIIALSHEPQGVDIAKPVAWIEATAVRESDGKSTKLPTHQNHLLCDEGGEYPAVLNKWEDAVLAAEMKRDGFKFWYRNPQHPSQDSLGFAYREGDETKIARPDFLFFAAQDDGTIAVDVVDPHGTHLADALPKLKGLADYARQYGHHFRRIEAVAEVDGKLRLLDMTREEVRIAVGSAEEATALYRSVSGRDFS
jgi:type III restriction enzyme